MQILNLLLSDGSNLKGKLESELEYFRPTYFKDFTGIDHGVKLVPIGNVEFYYDENFEITQKYRSFSKLNITHCENKLYNQFDTGIDTNQPVMVIKLEKAVYNDDGTLDVENSKFLIISGNNRLYMLKEFYPDVTHFPMQIVESDDESQIAIVGLAPNRTNPNVLHSGEQDVINTALQLIKNNKLEDNKKAIKAWVVASDRYASPQSKDNMVAQIIDRAGVKLTFRSITDGSVKKFYAKHGYEQTGDFTVFEQDGDSYHSSIVTKGYVSTKFFRALKRFLETGIPTLLDIYVSDKSLKSFDDPTDPSNITRVRAEILDEVEELRELFRLLVKKILAGEITELDDIMQENGFIAQLMGAVKREDPTALIPIFDSEIQAIFQAIRKKKAEKKEKQRLAEAQSDTLQGQVELPLDEFLKVG